jgi:hypothetical protein
LPTGIFAFIIKLALLDLTVGNFLGEMINPKDINLTFIGVKEIAGVDVLTTSYLLPSL